MTVLCCKIYRSLKCLTEKELINVVTQIYDIVFRNSVHSAGKLSEVNCRSIWYIAKGPSFYRKLLSFFKFPRDYKAVLENMEYDRSIFACRHHSHFVINVQWKRILKFRNDAISKRRKIFTFVVLSVFITGVTLTQDTAVESGQPSSLAMMQVTNALPPSQQE